MMHKKYFTFFPNIWNWIPWNYNQAKQKHTLNVQRLMPDILSPKRWNNNFFLTKNLNKLQKHHMLRITIYFKLLISLEAVQYQPPEYSGLCILFYYFLLWGCIPLVLSVEYTRICVLYQQSHKHVIKNYCYLLVRKNNK
jgi:hypothetical protein